MSIAPERSSADNIDNQYDFGDSNCARKAAGNQQKPVPYGPHNHLKPTETRASTATELTFSALAPTACDAFTTKVTPVVLQRRPMASRSIAQAENAWTHVRHNKRVRGDRRRAISSGSKTRPRGRSRRTVTP